MLFYPDQYFYAQGSRPDSRRSGRRAPSRGFRRPDDDDAPVWFQQGPPRASHTQVPDEYVVLDEDELNALRAFREARRRSSQRDVYEQERASRRRAEAERKAREAARREAEARMQAQIEANARAAAREYMRRQQARQQALLQAQHAERQRQQQYLMEQLRQQFGLFAVPTAGPFQEGARSGDDDDVQQQQQEAAAQLTAQIAEAVERAEAAENAEESAEAAAVAEQLQAAQAQAQAQAEADAQQQRSGQQRDEQTPAEEDFDPIRRLIEALAPYPFFVAAESSDDEAAQTRPDGRSFGDDDQQDADSVEFVVEPDTALGGPTCETASDDSEPVYIEEPEFRVFSATPPVPVEYDSSDDAPSLKDRRKERQPSAPVDQLKKAKFKESRKAAKKEAKEPKRRERRSREPTFAAERRPSSVEISGLLTALADELRRLQDAYVRLSSAEPTGDLRDVISRLEAVKIGYSRTEEIYNKLDEVRAGKDERKLKHEITTESVALADKYEKLLDAVYAEKKAVSSAQSPAQGEGATSGKAGSPKHDVVLEEVQDESD